MLVIVRLGWFSGFQCCIISVIAAQFDTVLIDPVYSLCVSVTFFQEQKNILNSFSDKKILLFPWHLSLIERRNSVQLLCETMTLCQPLRWEVLCWNLTDCPPAPGPITPGLAVVLMWTRARCVDCPVWLPGPCNMYQYEQVRATDTIIGINLYRI